MLQELARIAFFDIRKLYNDGGSTKRPSELGDDAAAVLAGVDVVEMFASDGAPITYTKKVKVPLWKKGPASFVLPLSTSCHNARISCIAPRVNASRSERTAGSRQRAQIPTTKRISIVLRRGGVLVTQIIGARIEPSTPNIPKETASYRLPAMRSGAQNRDCKERT